MAIKISKQITDRQKAFVYLHSLLLLQGPPLARALAALVPAAEGEKAAPPEERGFLPTILAFGGALRASLARLVEADEAHHAAKAAGQALIERRNSLCRGLTRRIVALRRTVIGQHENPDLGRLGMAGETAREPVPVLRQADRVAAILERGDLDALLGPPIFDDAPFEPRGRGQQLQAVAEELRGVLDEIGVARRRTEDALLEKRQALKAYDQLATCVTRTFENWCRLAGRDDLADRIRPGVRDSRAGSDPSDAPVAADQTRTDSSQPRLQSRTSSLPRSRGGGAGYLRPGRLDRAAPPTRLNSRPADRRLTDLGTPARAGPEGNPDKLL